MSQPTKDDRVPEGTWGGAHIRLNVRENGGDIEFDCAHGELSEPPVMDVEGRFDVAGTFVAERGGPIRLDHPPVARPARYVGSVSGETMTLRVRLGDKDEIPEVFTLTRGSEGRLWKCR